MTSNLGTEALRRQPFGFRPDSREEENDSEALRESVDAALKRAFRPEFLHCIDETIVFHPLDQEHIVQIVEHLARDVQARLMERGITFKLTTEAETWLAREGFGPVYGARPLRRAIQRQLENPLARMVLCGESEPTSSWMRYLAVSSYPTRTGRSMLGTSLSSPPSCKLPMPGVGALAQQISPTTRAFTR